MTGLLLASGGIVACAFLDKAAEERGFGHISTILKVALPIVGLIAGIYFFDSSVVTRLWR